AQDDPDGLCLRLFAWRDRRPAESASRNREGVDTPWSGGAAGVHGMTDPREDIRQLADEYVLGLLDRADRDAVETRLESDADLRRAVGASRDRFLELDLLAEPADHSPGLWAAIDARI